jgi:peptide deformylase
MGRAWMPNRATSPRRPASSDPDAIPRDATTPGGDRRAPSYTSRVSVRPILVLGDPRLRLRGEPVTSFGKPLHVLLDDLTATMRDAPGVGLAAPQVGEPMAACVIEVGDRLLELVNPEIVKTSGDDRDLEGCLSIPGYAAYVTRRERVWVVAQDRRGRRMKVAGSGLLGRALQHELDHLQGKLYIDYLDSLDELIPVGRGDDEAEEAPERPAGRVKTPALA